ncbi:MAG: YabP/YqfC family sporulation protein [Ruminococcus callidus]
MQENCRRILEYNDIRIVVQTAELVLEIWGSDLQADSRSPESLVIHGQINLSHLHQRGAPWNSICGVNITLLLPRQTVRICKRHARCRHMLQKTAL